MKCRSQFQTFCKHFSHFRGWRQAHEVSRESQVSRPSPGQNLSHHGRLPVLLAGHCGRETPKPLLGDRPLSECVDACLRHLLIVKRVDLGQAVGQFIETRRFPWHRGLRRLLARWHAKNCFQPFGRNAARVGKINLVVRAV